MTSSRVAYQMPSGLVLVAFAVAGAVTVMVSVAVTALPDDGAHVEVAHFPGGFDQGFG